MGGCEDEGGSAFVIACYGLAPNGLRWIRHCLGHDVLPASFTDGHGTVDVSGFFNSEQ